MYLLRDCRYFFTLSADDVARYRIALIWAENASFFPDPTWPPLPFWLGGLMIRLFSFGSSAMCILSIAASLLSIPLLGLLCLGLLPPSNTSQRQTQGFPVAITLAVFVLYPQWIWLGTCMLAESLYSLLMLLSITFFILAVERKTTRFAYAALIAAVLASMTRLEGIALAGLVFALLAWRLRSHRSKTYWIVFLIIGVALTAFFPIVWVMGHSGGAGTLDFLSTLKGGFTSKYDYNPLSMPIQLFRMYLSVFPVILFLILVGFSGVWHERKRTGMRDLLVYQTILIGGYFLAQCAAAMLGMMPTHSFWRLTFPLCVVLLPYLGSAFEFLGRFLPPRLQIAPALLCVFYFFPTFATPPLFVTPALYQSGIDIKEVKAGQSQPGKILIEAIGWEWLPLAVLGQGAYFDRVLFDQDPDNPQATNLNPPIFNLPLDALRTFLESHQVTLAVANTPEAKQQMMALGWKTERAGRYAVFTPPVNK